MEALTDLFTADSIKWIFSGIGVFALGLIISIVRSKKSKDKGDTIETKGDYSPGKVGGDYKVENKK